MDRKKKAPRAPTTVSTRGAGWIMYAFECLLNCEDVLIIGPSRRLLVAGRSFKPDQPVLPVLLRRLRAARIAVRS